MNELCGKIKRFGKEEHADLFDVSSGCDVNQILFARGVELSAERKIQQRRV